VVSHTETLEHMLCWRYALRGGPGKAPGGQRWTDKCPHYSVSCPECSLSLSVHRRPARRFHTLSWALLGDCWFRGWAISNQSLDSRRARQQSFFAVVILTCMLAADERVQGAVHARGTGSTSKVQVLSRVGLFAQIPILLLRFIVVCAWLQ